VEQVDLLRRTVEILETLAVPYMIVGSFASSVHGEPRMTQDIDIVIDPTASQLDQLCATFEPEDFYVSQEAARQALARRDQFNVIHPDSGNKIDFMIARSDAWGREQIERRIVVPVLPDRDAYVARPEDVILATLLYYQEGGSEKHLRDITGVLKTAGARVDRAYVEHWADRLGVRAEWSAVLLRVS
jgi:hypothetical protein